MVDSVAVDRTTSPLTDAERLRKLPWFVAQNVLNGVFGSLTIFGSIFVLYMNSLGLDKAKIGALLSLLPFCGLVAPLMASQVSRIGFKRVYVACFGARKIFILALVVLPYLAMHVSANVLFVSVACMVFGFALCRAIGETAVFPWVQEIVPNRIRGKVSAVISVCMTIAGMVAIGGASWVLEHYKTGYTGFQIIIAVGTMLGLISVWMCTRQPGGRPNPWQASKLSVREVVVGPMRDRNYRRLMLGVGLTTFGFACAWPFMPLYMKYTIGLADSQIVRLEIVMSAGAMLSSFLWGWAADRFGSRPVMVTGLAMLCVLPVIWLLTPVHSKWSVTMAIVAWVICGIGNTGWAFGFSRYLFVSAAPEGERTSYMAFYYAWLGLTGGSAPILAGRALDMMKGLDYVVGGVRIDAYTPLFAVYVAMMVTAVVILSRVRADGAMSTVRFVGMFLQGNLVSAVGSMFRYHRAKDEGDRIETTDRMGQARNPLNVDELVEALADPSFQVRYEAVVSIARMPAEPRLVEALLEVLVGDEPELALAAAWALGRLGDRSAVLPLRELLISDFPMLRSRSARSLALLGDRDSAGHLLEHLRTERIDSVRVAFAAALGALRAEEAVEDVLGLVKHMTSASTKAELMLALARMVGGERHYIRLWRRMREDAATASSQTVSMWAKPLSRRKWNAGQIVPEVERAELAFAEGRLAAGAGQLATMIEAVIAAAPSQRMTPAAMQILRACAVNVVCEGQVDQAWLLLTLHAMNAVLFKYA